MYEIPVQVYDENELLERLGRCLWWGNWPELEKEGTRDSYNITKRWYRVSCHVNQYKKSQREGYNVLTTSVPDGEYIYIK